MSRYSSIDSISSRRLTKCSWLFIRRRSSTDSFWISMRAVSGCERMSDEIEVSVLNRKCGLIWLLSASILAAISRVSCSCSRCSMRALFQILIGVATASTVARTTSTVMPSEGEPRIEEPVRAEARAERLAQELERHGGEQQDQRPVGLEPPHHLPHVLRQIDEHERARTARSLPWDTPRAGRRRRTRSRPRTGWPRTRRQASAGRPTRKPTSAPVYGPAMSPARNAPSSVRSAAS